MESGKSGRREGEREGGRERDRERVGGRKERREKGAVGAKCVYISALTSLQVCKLIFGAQVPEAMGVIAS